jgi:hypothetical protein
LGGSLYNDRAGIDRAGIDTAGIDRARAAEDARDHSIGECRHLAGALDGTRAENTLLKGQSDQLALVRQIERDNQQRHAMVVQKTMETLGSIIDKTSSVAALTTADPNDHHDRHRGHQQRRVNDRRRGERPASSNGVRPPPAVTTPRRRAQVSRGVPTPGLGAGSCREPRAAAGRGHGVRAGRYGRVGA